jgi:hypothetical protein
VKFGCEIRFRSFSHPLTSNRFVVLCRPRSLYAASNSIGHQCSLIRAAGEIGCSGVVWLGRRRS